jgi:cellulose synthase/poly-beta-1,6-N-acetylglucosamine synthase-like glycosyltransferase
MATLNAFLTILSLVLLVPAAVFLGQVLLALTFRPEGTPEAGGRPRVALLVPAHDEAAEIAGSLATITPQLRAQDRLLVVADNCSDDTAAIARAAGAEAVERTDAVRRGKGYALDYGLRHLAADPPEVVIIVDADCRVAPGAIDVLARTCASRNRPAQALYRMYAPEDAGVGLRIAEFAWLVKNHVRPLGLLKAGMPCQLTGAGMAFPWAQLGEVDLASGSIVEDMKLGIDLALLGRAAVFCPSALVTSTFPSVQNAQRQQRTRWEHGHLSLIVGELPRLLFASLRKADTAALGLAMDLAVPPVALLLILVLAQAALSGAALWFNGGGTPFLLSLLALAMIAAAILLAWLKWGRQSLRFGDLLFAPVYAARKLPLYARFWLARQKDWVRTGRGRDERR